MRRFMQRFQSMATNSLLLLLCMFLFSGCSWTGKQLGMSDSSSDADQSAEASQNSAGTANAADKRALLRLSFGITEPIHLAPKKRGPVQKQASYTTATPKAHADRTKSKNTHKMVVKRKPLDTAPKAEQEPVAPEAKKEEPAAAPAKPAQEAASPAAPAATAMNEQKNASSPSEAAASTTKKPKIDPKGPQPPTKLHTSVPFEPAKKTPPPPSKKQEQLGDIRYGTTKALREAVDKALKQKTFLGYTDPFDAFPALKGNDTMSAAFIPVDHPNHKVFYHAFYRPDQPYNRRVYGYTVIDMITKKDYGHFDGNADGKFEQETLHPKVVFEDYIRTSKSQFGEKMPVVKKDKK